MAEVDFIAGCPVEGCSNFNKKYTWIHILCGGTEKLSEYGILRCVKCNLSSELVNWLFNCGAHDFKPASFQGLMQAMSIMGSIKGIDMKFLLKLNESVCAQFAGK